MCAGLQRSGGARLTSPEEPAALQYLWEQTKATGGQKTGAIALGAANLAGLAILATLRANLGTLDRVKRLVKSLGMVNCVADFKDHPQVINGYSELMSEVFGPDAGVGARSAVGMGSLPGNISVEIEAIFEIG